MTYELLVYGTYQTLPLLLALILKVEYIHTDVRTAVFVTLCFRHPNPIWANDVRDYNTMIIIIIADVF